MQYTSFIPAYHANDRNVGSSAFLWHLLNSNAKYREENSCNMSLPPINMEQCSRYDKDILGEIIQNHDSMFRYQVQELHLLYKKQKELMDEMRLGKTSFRHSMSQASEFIHSFSHARSHNSQATTKWLRSDQMQQQLPNLISSNYFHSGNEIKFQNRTIDLEVPANVYRSDQSLFEALKSARNSPKKLRQTADSVKTGVLSSLDLNEMKESRCIIDLNEPVHMESLASSLICPTEINTCCMEITHKDSGLHNSDGSSDGTLNSPLIIDLNSMPDVCLAEIEMNPEHIRTIKKETTEAFDKCVEDDHHPIVDNKLLKTETGINLNIDAVMNQPSSPIDRIESLGNEDLVGPVSPENEECSPPRGESEENIQLEGPSVGLDTLAAQTLVTISARGARDCLSWFTEIVSAAGDDQGNDAPNLSSRVVEKGKETGILLSPRSRKSHSRGKRRHRDSRTEFLTCYSKEAGVVKGFLETGSSKRKRACAKPIKYSKVDKALDRSKKSVGSITKQPIIRSKQGGLQSWGKIKKRGGGLRRKASKFLVIS